MSSLKSNLDSPLDARFHNLEVYSKLKWYDETPNKSRSAFIVNGDSFFDGRVNISGKLTVSDLILAPNVGGTGGINIPGGLDGYVMMSDNNSSLLWRKQYWDTNDTPTSITGPSDNIIHSEYKIGLGITNPTEKLSIEGNAEINNLYIGKSLYDNNSIISLKNLKGSSDYYSIKIKSDNELNLNTSKSINFNINDSQVAIIDNSGNFGIGITNPQANLHVDGNAIIDGNLTVNGNFTTVNSEVVEIEDPMLFLGKNNPGDNVDIGIIGQYVENGITKYSGIFRDANGDTSYYNFFHNLEVKPTNTVDTSHPTYQYGNLHIGGLKVDTGITFTSSDAFIYSDDIIFDASGNGTGYVGFGVTSSPQDSIDVQNGIIVRDGNIKIGISETDASLHINRNDVIVIPVGNISERLDITGAMRFNTDTVSFEGYDGTNWGTLGGVKDVDQDTYISAEDSSGNDNDQLRFYTGGDERMIINDNGSVGINVSSSGNYTFEIDGFMGISGSILPKLDRVFNLGSSTQRWGDLYFGGETIYLGDSVLKDYSGTFTVTGPAQIDELSITQNVDIDGDLNVSGTSELNNINVSESINVSGSINITNDLYVTGDTNIKNNLNISGNTNILGAITASSINLSGSGDVNGDLNLSGDVSVGGEGTFNSLYVTNNVNIDGDLDVSGTLTLYNISVSNNLYVTNNTYINTLLYVTGNTNIQNNLTVEGNSQLESLNVTNNVDIDGTLDVVGNTQLKSLNVTNNVDIDGTLDVAQNTQLYSLNVTNNVDIDGTLDVAQNTQLESLNVTNDVDIDGTLNVGGNSQLESLNVTNDVDIDGSLNVSGSLEIYNLYVSNNAYITNDLNVSGNTQLDSLNVTNDTNLNGSLNVTGTSNYYGPINSYDIIRLYDQENANLAGYIRTSNETTFNNKISIESARGAGGIQFKTNPEGTLETAMFIDAEGNIGMGVTNQTEKLEVLGNTKLYGNLDVTGNTTIGGLLKVTGNTDLDGTLNVEGDTVIQSTLDVQNATRLDSLTVTNNSNLLGNLNVEGNLTVQGTTTTVNSEIVTIEDPLLHLASNNTTNVIDFGFYGKYVKPHPLIVGVDVTYYSGLVRDATDGCYILFDTRTEPTTTVDTSSTNFSLSCLKLNSMTTNNANINNKLTVSGNSQLESLNVSGNTDINGTLDVASNSQLNSLNVTNNVDIDGTLDVAQNTQLESLNVTNNVDIDGTLDVAQNTQLESLNVTNNVDIDGTLDVAGNSQLNSLNVTGNTDINGTLDVAGNSQLDSLNVTGNTDIDGTLNVEGDSTLYNIYVTNNAYISNDLYVTNNTTLQGILNVTDSVNFSNTLSVSGDLSVNDTFFVDISEDKVGINTNTPETSLHISGTDGLVLPVGDNSERIDVTGAIRYNSETSSFEGYSGGTWGTLGGTKDVDGDTYISAENTPGEDNDQLKFYTAGSEKMVVDTNGNVGIGITNPNNKLHVYTKDSFSYINVDRGNTNSDSGIRFQDNGADEWVFYSEGSTGDFFINEGTSDNRLKIKAGGYLGIGVSNPSYPLDITGINDNTKSSLLLRNGNNVSTFSDGAQIRFGWNGSDEYAHFIHTRHNSAGVNNAIDFYVNDGTQNNTVTNGSIYSMTINDGKLGIGVTNPSQKLDVIGNAYVSEFLGVGSSTISYPLQVETLNNNNWSSRFQNNNAQLFLLHTNGNAFNLNSGVASLSSYLFKLRNTTHSNIFNVMNDNKVGINTDAPNTRLEVSVGLDDGAIIGDGFIGNHTNTANQFIITHKDLRSNTNDYAIRQLNNGQTSINSKSGQDLKINLDNSEQIIIKSDGKIGIHTTSPNENVEIQDKVLINTTENIALTVTNTLTDIYIGNEDGNGIFVQSGTTLNKALDLKEHNNDLFIVYNNGDIVLGSTQGDNKLSIEDGLSILNDNDSLNINVTNSENIIESDNQLSINISGNDIFNVKKDYVNINGDLNQEELNVSGSAYITDSLYVGGIPSSSDFNLYVSGDTKLNGDVVISGILNFEGVSIDGLEFQDSLIKFGNNNTNNTEDIGFYGKYIEIDTTKYTGLFSDASDDNQFVLFKDLEVDPSTTVDITDSTFRYADLRLNKLDTIGQVGIGITNPSVQLHISGTDGIVIPVGNTSERVDVTGAIRYNKETQQFEGYSGTWGSLGGVIDVDQDTYISAENSAGSDNDELKFVTANGQRMIIDNSGNIGISTSNPGVKLHISSTDGIVIPVGDTSQRVDITGAIRYNEETQQFEGYSGTWGSLGGVIDVDQDTYISAENSPGSDNDQLKFYTGALERMRVDSNGRVGIGITNPQYSLDVDGIIQSNDEIFSVEFTATSDIRVKENIKRYQQPFLEKLCKLNLFEYNFIKDYSKNNETMYGLLAQNVEEVIPEAIKTKKVKVNDKNIDDFLTISQNTLITYLIGSVQQLSKAHHNLADQFIKLHKDYNELKESYNLEKELKNYRK